MPLLRLREVLPREARDPVSPERSRDDELRFARALLLRVEAERERELPLFARELRELLEPDERLREPEVDRERDCELRFPFRERELRSALRCERPDWASLAVSRLTSLLKLLRWPRAVFS